MGWIIFSVIVVVVVFCALGLDMAEEAWKLRFRQIFALCGLLFLIPGCFSIVPANHVGIVYSPFAGTSETTLPAGYHGKNILDKVYTISTEVQTQTVENLTTQTKDAQYLTSTLDIKYKVRESNAYLVFTQFRTLDKMSESLIVPTTQRVLELITTRYNVIDVLGEKRSEIYSELAADLKEELEKYGVEFYSISIVDMDAGDDIEAAITAEAVAKKAVETAQYELQKAETEAKKQSVVAQAEQDAAKIKAETKVIEAQAEKEANELLNLSLTQLILIQEWIEKWNGEPPMYYGGTGADLIFNTGKLSEEVLSSNEE